MMWIKYQNNTNRKAFTLIELLVVIAIIALLVSILLPSLNKARELARNVVCLSNLHSIQMALNIYGTENEDYLPQCSSSGDAEWDSPDTDDWCDWLGRMDSGGFLAIPDIPKCPSSTITHKYTINGHEGIQIDYGINEAMARPSFKGYDMNLPMNLVPASRRNVLLIVADSSYPIITGYQPNFRARVANANSEGQWNAGDEADPSLARHLEKGSSVFYADNSVTMVDQYTAMYGYLTGDFYYTPSGINSWW